MKEDKHTFSSGATSSEHKVDFHLIPTNSIRRKAGRFTLGKEKHGDVNYQKCIAIEEDGTVQLDVAFARDRWNHGFDHYLRVKDEGLKGDDHIGAVEWAASFVDWVASFGFDWKRILTPRYVNEILFRLNPTKTILEVVYVVNKKQLIALEKQ